MSATETINTAITIRRMDTSDADREAVARLAAVDSHRPLDGPVLGLEVEGSLLAAVELNSGASVADPFSRTSELQAMLKLRATQLRRRQPKGARGSGLLRRRPRPALGGSPPGQIISMPRWG